MAVCADEIWQHILQETCTNIASLLPYLCASCSQKIMDNGNELTQSLVNSQHAGLQAWPGDDRL